MHIGILADFPSANQLISKSANRISLPNAFCKELSVSDKIFPHNFCDAICFYWLLFRGILLSRSFWMVLATIDAKAGSGGSLHGLRAERSYGI